MILKANTGEVIIRMNDGGARRWKPSGPLVMSETPPATKSREKEKLGTGAMAARLFIGLNVEETPTWTPEHVIDLVYKIRKAQGVSGDLSVLAQHGIYEDTKKRRIDEKSLQVVLLDLAGDPEFTDKITILAEELRTRLKQERVIVEIQQGGVTKEVFSATDPAILNKANE
jgi:hypothetical protein